MPNWEVYVELNFTLPDPGPDGAVKELRKMVETRKTPDYKGGKKGGEPNPIPPRDLGDSEWDVRIQLMRGYDKKSRVRK